jgi:hypothetical protein
MVALWWNWHDLMVDVIPLVGAYFQALPLALLAVYVLPALAFAGGGAVWEFVRSLRVDR